MRKSHHNVEEVVIKDKFEGLVAYKTWKCKFCSETRDDPCDMWAHLREVHGVGSVETGAGLMYERR